MFSAHKIRSKRILCMRSNPRYADEYLIRSYNKSFTVNMKKKGWHQIDVPYIFLTNFLAHMIDPDLELYNAKEYNNNENTIRKIFLPKFEEDREVIRNHDIGIFMV